MTHSSKKCKLAAKEREICLYYDDDLTPTEEEWAYLTDAEPELTLYQDQIRKNGKISEEY